MTTRRTKGANGNRRVQFKIVQTNKPTNVQP